jgi:hypothetical protein
MPLLLTDELYLSDTITFCARKRARRASYEALRTWDPHKTKQVYARVQVSILLRILSAVINTQP